jgi:hypothetical protein
VRQCFRSAAFLAALAVASFAHAEVKIEGPTEVKRDRMVRLTAVGQVDGKALIWTVSNEDDIDPDEEGLKFNFVAPPGVYRVKLIAIGLTKDGKTTKETAAPHTVKIVGTPDPKPPDPPGPIPPDPPKPPPGPITKAWVVVVEENTQASAIRGLYFADPALKDYIVKKGWKFRSTDKNVKDASGNTPADLKPYVDIAKDKTLPWLFVIDQSGKLPYEGALPSSPAEMLALLKKIGGDA